MHLKTSALRTLLGALLPLGTLVAQQGTLRGAVRDRDFDLPLVGAEVTVLEISRKATTSDQGRFTLSEVPAGRYTVLFAKDGYVRQVRADVLVTPGQLTDLDVALSGEFAQLDDFIVQDLLQLGTGTETALLQLRLSSASLLDSIGSEMMSRAGASDAAGALRLVAGASLQDGKSAVIRGLPDRYVTSQLNGMRLPTADENKRAVELDQFPSAVIDSIQVSKTFTPDQQGDASGGAVNLQLKGIPDEPFFLRFKAQAIYNTQVTGREDFLTYHGGGFDSLGRDSSRRIQSQNLGRSWTGAAGTTEGDAPTDGKWALAGGGRFDLGQGVQLGLVSSFFHERTSSLSSNGFDNSYWVESPGAPMTPRTSQGTPSQGDFKTSLFDITQGRQTLKWGNLTTIGVSANKQALSLTWLYTSTAEDRATLAEDTRGKQYFFPGYDPDNPATPGHGQPQAAPYLRLETLDYTERTTATVQLHGQHTLDLGEMGSLKAPELDWTLAHSGADLDEPDKRQFGEQWIPGRTVGPFVIPPVHLPYKPAANFTLGNFQRIFKTIAEDSDQVAVNLKLPFTQWSDSTGYVKFGVFHDELHRDFNQDSFSNFGDNSTYRGRFDQFWSRAFPGENHPISASLFDVDYRGRQRITATYAMLDLPLTSFLDVIGGVRLESTAIGIVNFPEANATWFPPGSLAPTQLRPGDADVGFHQDDALPSFGLQCRPLDGLTLRASYGETVARQTFKELSPILQQEFLGGPVFIGNPRLQMSAVRNYDLRADYAPYEGGLLSASWFYKDIRRPIEYVQRIVAFDFTTPVNYPSGTMQGFEFEARQDLGRLWEPLAGLTAGANATFLESQVRLPQDEIDAFLQPGIRAYMGSRDMTNAPDHLYNLYATYDLAATGTQFALFYTLQGDALIAGAGAAAGNYVPNEYALGFDTLNASVTQDLGKGVKLQLGAKNLTNPEIREAYRSPYIGGDVTRSSFTRGVEYSIAVSWEIKL